MKMRFVAGAIVLVAGTGVGIFASSASAEAKCPQGKICFYHDVDNSGSMSLQERLTSTPYSIYSFQHSHYTNGETLDNSASSVVNNSDRCLNLFPDPNFRSVNNGIRVIVGPHIGVNLNAYIGDSDNSYDGDSISSAYTYAPDKDGKCDGGVARHQSKAYAGPGEPSATPEPTPSDTPKPEAPSQSPTPSPSETPKSSGTTPTKFTIKNSEGGEAELDQRPGDGAPSWVWGKVDSDQQTGYVYYQYYDGSGDKLELRKGGQGYGVEPPRQVWRISMCVNEEGGPACTPWNQSL
ncbi:peptidase inhibitor family I36 protein [Streptomyces sp. Lzd4kr]|nr:peptidase inhibitor family I36 protein [Streptomyces sp. Lzd4kr]